MNHIYWKEFKQDKILLDLVFKSKNFFKFLDLKTKDLKDGKNSLVKFVQGKVPWDSALLELCVHFHIPECISYPTSTSHLWPHLPLHQPLHPSGSVAPF